MAISDVARIIRSCRSCGSENLAPILSLGEIYVSDFVESSPRHGKVPLKLVLCEDCNLLQLRHTTNPEMLYRQYWYKSSINESIVRDLQDIASKAERLVDLNRGDIVLDVGANDGTLLRLYETEGLRLVGFEPAINLVEDAKKGTTLIINDFFNYDAFRMAFGGEKAKVLTCIAMFYDLDDPNKFVSDVVKCLDPEGLWIIEMRYLPSMLEQNDVGNVVHEHLEYYSLLSLSKLLGRHDLEVFDVELNQVNGGSFRTYVRHQGGSISPFEGAEERIKRLEAQERELGLQNRKVYDDFAARFHEMRFKLRKFVKQEHERGKIIHVYGASTKGNTLLQFCGLDNTLIEAAAERDHTKVGKRTVGTSIPIITEEESRRRADYFLILPWHFLDVFKIREREFLESGGKFIVPLPEFKVIGYENLEE